MAEISMKPEKKSETYEAALSKAWESLLALDPKDVAKKSGVSYSTKEDAFILPFLGEEYLVQRSKKVVLGPNGQEVFSFMAVLLIHYLAYAKDIKPQKRLISFRELSGGDVYFSAFSRRAILPITNTFGSDEKMIRRVGERIGAFECNYGDVSFTIDVFPKVPVTIIMWIGDEEVACSSNMLFDASIKELLPTEDVAVIGGFVASKLKKIASSLKV
jgi:hypothetical protein